MQRDFENPQRHQSRVIINDYPSSHLPPAQRPKFWGAGQTGERLPQRALSYVERPCIPREIDRLRQPHKHGLLSTTETSRRQRSGGDNGCRVDGSGLSPAHCSPCYVSSALIVGDKSRHRSVEEPDTASQVRQLSALVTRQLQKAATSGCDSIVMPQTTSTKQVERIR